MLSKLLLTLMLLLQGHAVIVEKIAAVVNEEIITLGDINRAILFYPVFQKQDETEGEFYNRVLQDLINYKVIYLEYKDDFIPKDDDFEAVQIAIIKKVGSLKILYDLFDRLSMDWQDFKLYITEKVMYEEVLERKFQLKIVVNFKEIENFYNQQYLPLQRKLNLQPKTLVEMAGLIEKHLQKEKIEERLAGWLQEMRALYDIENKLTEE